MRAAAVLAALAALAGPAAVEAAAALYSYTDASGVTHFTNVPSDERYREVPGSAAPKPAQAPPRAGGGGGNFEDDIERLSAAHGVDRDLVKAVVKAESNFNPGAVSRAGALGLMQLMPETARLRSVSDPFDPLQNLDGGIRHLKHLLETFGDTRLALAAYNAGENAVRRHNGVPPFAETRSYVATVLSHYGRYSGGAPTAAVVTATPAPQIHTFVNDEGVRVFTNVPWKYLGSPSWKRERAQ